VSVIDRPYQLASDSVRPTVTIYWRTSPAYRPISGSSPRPLPTAAAAGLTKQG